ncbi:dTDP-4-amino-4,6-dideoxygalactose transaminase [uncultured Desulfovibrio sp.]|mgnify:CR=1 FL=1|uniref:dTDP-4-amino-4,6-dideoxygalactose transaminase n=1 Tax=uncultured Desulfovibrio sp. TaxID=167968 RepID=UPI00260462E7|nr:dTDP-4-amino-4,6-dideoxygalactose transaminase [uncultured Desulfovibrio sp.]
MINFNEATYTEQTIKDILEVFKNKKVCGDGKFTHLCNEYIENKYHTPKALLTHSCTAALEMAAILAEVGPGDEVIMPSYTFVSTANAFVLQGATPVFIDIRDDTLNLDETLIEDAITSKTKAIVPVHYAGVGCEMDTILEIAKRFNLVVIEDAAQGFDALYKNKQLGTIGDMGCFSFHETKNIMSGEGGCFVTNSLAISERAEIIREKGTNRSKFFRGQVDKYTWVDKGSSYLPSDIIAAYLYSILNISSEINIKRLSIWNKYYEHFSEFEKKGIIRLPFIPKECTHNAHMFYIRFPSLAIRTKFIDFLRKEDIIAPFHYIPLHSSPAGKKFGRAHNELNITNMVSDTLVRLPIFYDLSEENLSKIIDLTTKFIRSM